jgi:hypothetical protein
MNRYGVVGSTEYTQSGNAHFLAYDSSVIEKSALAGEGEGCTLTLFHYIYCTIKYKVVVYAPAERVDTLPLFLLLL